MKSRREFLLATAGAAVAGNSPLKAQERILGVYADTGPDRTESGVGALMPWADRLWASTYHAEPDHGGGAGLWVVDDQMRIERIHVHNGCHTNRLVHDESQQISIGPYWIDTRGNFRFSAQLRRERLTATMTHLTDPKGRVYLLTMAGVIHEQDVETLQSKPLVDLKTELNIKGQPHFKGAFTSQGRIVVANNTYAKDGDPDGKLAEWDGRAWRVIENKPFLDVASHGRFSDVIFANGWDQLSAILKICINGRWQTIRLPKGSQTFEHYWQSEWTRIREVETERYLMDCHGIFYELSPVAIDGSIWGILPICRHLRVVPDFCSYRGYFVMGGNQNTPVSGNLLGGQPQSGIWFGKTDDLWKFGKPQGWGGVWRKTEVKVGESSDPFLMTGFDNKTVHLKMEARRATPVDIEVDFTGRGDWEKYETVAVPANGYKYHVFPPGFAAHFVRLTARGAAVATAEFVYT